MTSIDELFKGVGNKRKLEPLKDPNEIYKSARLNGSDSKRQARVEEEPNHDDDVEAGPAAPPEDDDGGGGGGDYGPTLPPEDDGDDEEGRFFGGGVSAQQATVLDYVDEQEPKDTSTTEPEKFDVAWLRRTAVAFERKINRNAEQRAKFADAPARFIGSEAELDAAIKALSILSQHPGLYGEFARLGCAASLASLLAHENADVAIDALEIVGELTDEDTEADEAQWGALVDALLAPDAADLLGLLAGTLERLDEAQDADRAGVYGALRVLENLCAREATAERIAAHPELPAWLLRRIQAKEEEEDPVVSQNKQYSAEVLAILVQSSRANRRRLAALDACDVMLQLVAPYRRRDPDKANSYEEEYMENLFEALTCLADEPEGKAAFVAAEGVELCLLMVREGKRSRLAALRLLDHAAAGSAAAATPVCLRIVEAGGLKALFTLFMKKSTGAAEAEHLLGLFASLLRLLPGGSPERVRALAKFVEQDYAKTAKLVQLRRRYAAQLARAEEAIRAEQMAAAAERDEERADEWFSRRLDAGLFALQTLDVVLAWLVAEDAGAARTVRKLLAEQDEGFGALRASLRERVEGIDAEDAEDAEEAKDTREMLETLMRFLQD
ncbi:Catenin-beta-like protein [Xylariomycetidae sp. FL0641]|nr:Catenin-beta-like protein [Xylariomycetidae sp. FL0641]